MNIIPDTIGIFYPDNKSQLLKLLNGYKRHNNIGDSKLIIVPHAGYEFCGRILFDTYSHLSKTIQNLTVIAPAIHNKIFGILTAAAPAFTIPLGDLKISPYNCDICNEIFVKEPALTVQLPIIKYFFPEISITPIVYGCVDFNEISNIINNNIEKSAIVIVSNLSRFVPLRESQKLDAESLRKIENLQTVDFDTELADGAVGICAAIKYAKQNSLKLVKTAHANSSEVNEDTSNVVGYGGWHLNQ